MFNKIYKLIYSSQAKSTKNKILLLIIISMFAGILETLTIISFMPLITAFMDLNILINSDLFIKLNFLQSLEKKKLFFF